MEAAFDYDTLVDFEEVSEPEACTAEVAECTCPDFCERDHANE